MPDYIPRSDVDFNEWINNFMQELNSRVDTLGITDAEFTALDTAHGAWGNAYDIHKRAQTAAATASQQKQAARETFVSAVRPVIARTQMHPNMQDADRNALGITVRSTERAPAPTPTTRPIAQVDTSQRLRHTISFSDETTPSRRGKPEGVRGCEIWVKIGDPAPVDASEADFLAFDTASPYVSDYSGADAGKTAHYMLRWVNTREEKGPWSTTVSATIPA
jgi:hypothetical protein